MAQLILLLKTRKEIWRELLFPLLFGFLIIFMRYVFTNILSEDISNSYTPPVNMITDYLIPFLAGIIGIILSYFFRSLLKIKFIYTLLSYFLIVLIFGVFLSVIGNFPNLLLYQYNAWDIIVSFFGGILLGSLLHTSLSYSKGVFVVLLSLLFSANAGYFADFDYSLIRFLSLGIMIFITILFTTAYQFLVFGVQIRKFLNKLLPYFAVILIIMPIGYSIMYKVMKRAEEIDKRIDMLNNMISEQEREENQKTRPCESDLDILDMNNKCVEPFKNQTILGYYKSSIPVYLKLEVFDFNRTENELKIERSKSIQFKNYDEYENTYTTEVEVPGNEDGSYIYKHSPERNIEVIFKFNDDNYVPTAEKVTAFQDENFDKNVGLFDGKGEDNIWYGSYSHVNYNPYGDYELEEVEPFTDFTEVAKNSERYNEIKALTERLIENEESDYEKARAIEMYLQQNYYYSFAPGIEDQKMPIDDFILDVKHGYCAHFAAAMTLMLETVEVDARMVGGVYSESFNNNLDAYILKSRNLHAWVEVYIDDYGWAAFDPTSERCDPEFDLCHEIRNLIPGMDRTSRYELEGVDPELSFDDLFERKIHEETGLIQVEGFDFDSERKVIELPEREKDKLEEEIEEIKKEEEKKEKRKEEIKQKLRTILPFLIGGVILISLILISYFAVRFWDRWDEYKKQHDRKRIRRVDKKIREHLINNNEIDKKYISVSSRKFLSELEKKDKVNDELIEVYGRINRVLYDKKYSEKDILRIVDFYRGL